MGSSVARDVQGGSSRLTPHDTPRTIPNFAAPPPQMPALRPHPSNVPAGLPPLPGWRSAERMRSLQQQGANVKKRDEELANARKGPWLLDREKVEPVTASIPPEGISVRRDKFGLLRQVFP
eukprot:3742175-Prymnesium_polylepis.1